MWLSSPAPRVAGLCLPASRTRKQRLGLTQQLPSEEGNPGGEGVGGGPHTLHINSAQSPADPGARHARHTAHGQLKLEVNTFHLTPARERTSWSFSPDKLTAPGQDFSETVTESKASTARQSRHSGYDLKSFKIRNKKILTTRKRRRQSRCTGPELAPVMELTPKDFSFTTVTMLPWTRNKYARKE